MKIAKGKNLWALFLFLLAGIVLGGFLGKLVSGVPALSWLNYGTSFGLDSPFVLNLEIIVLTFGIQLKVTIGSIIGMVIGAIVYRFM